LKIKHLFKASNQGSTITIITSKEGYHFIEYTSLSCNSSSGYVQDSSKQYFIFTLINPQKSSKILTTFHHKNILLLNQKEQFFVV
jgi:hypothetical protein